MSKKKLGYQDTAETIDRFSGAVSRAVKKDMEKNIEATPSAKTVREIRLEDMAEQRTAIDTAIETWNALQLDKEAKLEDITQVETTIAENVKKYSANAKLEGYWSCCQSTEHTPFYEACRIYNYPTVRVSTKTTDGVREKSADYTALKAIDLRGLSKYADRGSEVDKAMNYEIDVLCMYWAFRTNRGLGHEEEWDELCKLYDRSQFAGESREEGIADTSNTKALALLQKVVTSMIGENERKCIGVDLRYIDMVFAKKDKNQPCTVRYASNDDWRNTLMNVCHRVITGCTYQGMFKAAGVVASTEAAETKKLAEEIKPNIEGTPAVVEETAAEVAAEVIEESAEETEE